MVKVNNVVLNRLRGRDDIADQLGIGRNFYSQGVFNGVDRGKSVNHRADATDTLRPDPSLARVTPTQDQLDSPEHRAGTPGVRDHPRVHLSFDAKMPLNPRDRIDYNPRH
jgi:hypothetical protein